MPVIKNNTVLAIARDLKAFLKLEAGVTRSGMGEKPSGPGEKLTEARRTLASKEREIEGLRSGALGASSGVRAENVVWIFGYGSGRCGTTWLSRMFHDLSNCTLWSSPRVADLFGQFYYKHISSRRNYERKEHILGADRSAWLDPMRSFILDSAGARYPEFTRPGNEDRYLVINEVHGSLGAPLIMEALPESRIILMMRDPRDVAASVLDGRREGSWIHEAAKRSGTEDNRANSDPASQVRNHVENNLETMSHARQAYENHKGYKTILKYEDLRADTLGAMKRAIADLGLEVDEAELARTVRRHSWENVPEEEKGKGKFYRKATPGGWKEDLASEEIEIIEASFSPLIEEFYPSGKQGGS